MDSKTAVAIARLQAQFPHRSYQSCAAQIGKGGAEAKAAKQRRKNEQAREQRKNLYVSWSSRYENY